MCRSVSVVGRTAEMSHRRTTALSPQRMLVCMSADTRRGAAARISLPLGMFATEAVQDATVSSGVDGVDGEAEFARSWPYSLRSCLDVGTIHCATCLGDVRFHEVLRLVRAIRTSQVFKRSAWQVFSAKGSLACLSLSPISRVLVKLPHQQRVVPSFH